MSCCAGHPASKHLHSQRGCYYKGRQGLGFGGRQRAKPQWKLRRRGAMLLQPLPAPPLPLQKCMSLYAGHECKAEVFMPRDRSQGWVMKAYHTCASESASLDEKWRPVSMLMPSAAPLVNELRPLTWNGCDQQAYKPPTFVGAFYCRSLTARLPLSRSAALPRGGGRRG